jgi:hypothetical protein
MPFVLENPKYCKGQISRTADGAGSHHHVPCELEG